MYTGLITQYVYSILALCIRHFMRDNRQVFSLPIYGDQACAVSL